MDRVGKLKSAREDQFKKKSTTLDKRALRGHRRSIEWKQLRDDVVNLKRNIQMSPLEEEAKVPKEAKPSRRDLLMKWKQEKEIKKKFDVQEKARKKPFVVTHVEKEALDFTKPFRRLPKVDDSQPKPACITKAVVVPTTRVTRSSTQAVNKPAAPPSHKTRNASTSKVSATTKLPAAKEQPTHTRSTAVAAPSKPNPAPKKSTRQRASVHSTGSTDATTHGTNHPLAKAEKNTREVSKAKPSAKTNAAKTVLPKRAGKSSSSEEDMGQHKFDAHRITTSRGTDFEAPSFAPLGFQFQADTVSQFEFKPLSPSSAAGFLFPTADGSSFWASPECTRNSTKATQRRLPSLSAQSSSRKATPKKTPAADPYAFTSGTESEPDVKPSTATPMKTRRSSIRHSEARVTSDKQNKAVESGGPAALQLMETGDSTCTSAEEATHQAAGSTPGRKTQTSARRSRQSTRRSRLPQQEDQMQVVCESNDQDRSADPVTTSANAEPVFTEPYQESDSSKPLERSRRKSTLHENDSATEEGSLSTGTANTSEGSDSEKKEAAPRRRRSRRSKVAAPDVDSELLEKAKEDALTVVLETSTDQPTTEDNIAALVEPIAMAPIAEESEPGDDVQESNTLEPMETDQVFTTTDTPRVTQSSKAKQATSASRSESVFRTPGSILHRKNSSRSRSLSVTFSGTKRTPREIRSSLILKSLSPEEGVEVLMCSPMVEMRRGKSPKTSKSPEDMPPVQPMPDLDDLDEILTRSSQSSGSESEEHHSMVITPISEQRQEEEVSADAVTMEMEETVTAVVTEQRCTEVRPDSDMASSIPAPAASHAPSQQQESPEQQPHDVPYFRSLMVTQTERLTDFCQKWEAINEDTNLTEEVHGQIRTTVGQAQLLMSQRFKQFRGLVDNCEFSSGEKEIHCSDLQGFWDMIYFQIEDVDAKFVQLDKRREQKWQADSPPKESARALKKKAVSKPASKAKPAAAKSRFADFRAHLKQQKQVVPSAVQNEVASQELPVVVEPAEEVKMIPAGSLKTFDAGFFSVTSPIKSPKRLSAELTPKRGTSSGNSTPLVRAVLQRAARRSMIPHTPKDGDSGCVTSSNSSKSKALAVPSPLAIGLQGADGTPTSTRWEAEPGKQQVKVELPPGGVCGQTPLTASLATAGSIFTPENDSAAGASPVASSARRSSRKSLKLLHTDAREPETSQDEVPSSSARADPLNRLLCPSIVDGPQDDNEHKENAYSASTIPCSPSRVLCEQNSDMESPATTFGHLKLGSTPGPDGRLRRVSKSMFSPSVQAGFQMQQDDEEQMDDSPTVNLMSFSPLPLLKQVPVRAMEGNNTPTRRSTRLSRVSLL